MHTHARTGGEFGADSAVFQCHRVVPGLGLLAGVVELRGVAAAGCGDIAAFEFDLAGLRHQQDIAQVRMPGAGEVRMRETDNRAVALPIPGGPAVGLLARFDLRVRAQLHHAERHRGAGIGVAFAAGADKRVHRLEASVCNAWRSDAGRRGEGGKQRQPAQRRQGDRPMLHAEGSRRMQRRTVAQLSGLIVWHRAPASLSSLVCTQRGCQRKTPSRAAEIAQTARISRRWICSTLLPCPCRCCTMPRAVCAIGRSS